MEPAKVSLLKLKVLTWFSDIGPPGAKPFEDLGQFRCQSSASSVYVWKAVGRPAWYANQAPLQLVEPESQKSLYLASQTLLPEVSRPDPADPGLDHAWSGPLLTKPGFSGAQALSPQSLSPKSCPILTFTFVLTPVFGSGAPAAGSGRSALPSCRGSQVGHRGFYNQLMVGL